MQKGRVVVYNRKSAMMGRYSWERERERSRWKRE